METAAGVLEETGSGKAAQRMPHVAKKNIRSQRLETTAID
jgi:hypothetical protein